MTADARIRADLRQVASPRPTRTDAARNYDAIVAAAREEFVEQGIDASLKAVARRAGVGIATLYRNFPTRAALLEAVYIDDVVDTVSALCRTAESGAATRDEPDEPSREAWRRLGDWLDRFARTVADDPVLCEMFTAGSPALSPCWEALGEAVAGLLARSGTTLPLRCGSNVDEILRAVVSVAVSPFLTDVQRRRVLAVLLDGVGADRT
ncbi:TetR/AcrR family transcriptional regulator [Streptomyces sp. NPDC048521]|uniref:TetR/AcrR family transcriptional regulator n=1 Tax=Streptomyces sp. NPDC048521 TaxID=3365566 RepID=UPI0037188594